MPDIDDMPMPIDEVPEELYFPSPGSPAYDVTLHEAETAGDVRNSLSRTIGRFAAEASSEAMKMASEIDDEATRRKEAAPTDILYIEDIREVFRCGDSKARGIMRELPSQRAGKRLFVMRKDLESYIERHGGVTAKWPKRRR